MTIERVTFEAAKMEVREAGDGSQPTITGYAVVFDAWSQVLLDGRGRPFRERIAPSAFDRWLATNPDIRALWNHNPDYPLGRTRNGTLTLTKDATGLRVELTPADTQWGRDAITSIRSGVVTGMSFAFQKTPDGDTIIKGADGIGERTLLDADLYEVSPVTFPAYLDTSVAVRSAVVVPDFDESDDRAVDEIEMRSRAAARQREVEILRLEIGDYGHQ